MRISSIFSQLSGLSLSVMMGFAVFAVEPLVSSNEAKAESYHYSASHAGKRYKAPSATATRVGTARSGVRFGKNKHYYKKPHRYYHIKKRQREIARRNLRVQEQNELRRLRASTRRSGPNGRFLSQRERIELLNNNVIDSEFVSTNQGYELRALAKCPASHNCGYRLYEDGTGPRIIKPGVYLGNNLPNYDGLNGPKVITLD